MNVMDLMAKISLDSQDFNKELGESKSNFSKFGSALSSGAKTVGKVATASIAAIGTAVVGTSAAFIKGASATADYADNIDKMSQKMGFSAEAFQEWDFIMKHNGSSIDAVKSSMIKLDKALESDTDAWSKLGLSQEELLAMSPEDKFEATIKALQGVTDENEKAALAQDIFGKSYQEMMPLLNQSAAETDAMKQQVHDLNGVMSDEAVKAGAAYNDSLQNMKTALSGAKNNLMGEFLPSLTTAMDGLTALFTGDSSGIEKIKQGISGLASKLNELMPKVIEVISGVTEALISALPDFVQTFASQIPSILSSLIPILVNALVSLADSLADALPKAIEVIQQNIGVITQGLTKVIMTIGKLIVQIFPKVFPMLIKVGVQLITELAKGLTSNMSDIIAAIIECVNVIITELSNPETLKQLLQCGLELTIALIKGIIENAPALLAAIAELVGNVVSFLVTDGIPMILDAAIELFQAVGTGALKAWDFITSKLGELIGKIVSVDGIAGWISDVLDGAKKVFESIGDAVSGAWETIKNGVVQFGKDIWNGIKEGLGDMLAKGKELILDLFEGIKSGWNKVKNFFTGGAIDTEALTIKAIKQQGYSEEQAKEASRIMKEKGEADAKAYLEGQKKGYDIHSPSKAMSFIGEMVMAGFSNGVKDQSDESFDEIENTFAKFKPELNLEASVSTKDSLKAKSIGKDVDTETRTLEKIYAALEYMAKQGFKFTLPVFIGNKQIDEQTVDSVNRLQLRSGGQVNV